MGKKTQKRENRWVRWAKRLPVIGTMLFATFGAPKSMAQTNGDKLLAKATAAKMPNFTPEVRDYINTRAFEEYEKKYKGFSHKVAKALGKNIAEVIKAKQKGPRAKAAMLKKLFGSETDTRFYCAQSAFKTLMGIANSSNYTECSQILKQVKNPQSCTGFIEGLSEAYGDDCKTNNVRAAIKQMFKKNPNDVLICIVQSKTNSRSGFHLVVVTPTFAADSIVSSDGKGTAYSLNTESIKDTDKYFIGEKNKGHVFSCSELIKDLNRQKIFTDWMEGKLTLPKDNEKDQSMSRKADNHAYDRHVREGRS